MTTGSGRPSRNSQGICNILQQPAMPMTSLPEMPPNPAIIQSTPVNLPLARSILPDNSSHVTTVPPHSNSLVVILIEDKHVEVLTPCMRQHDRFVNPMGKLLRPDTVNVCEDLPFAVSNNGKIYNFMGGNMKQLYVTDLSKQTFLIKAANTPSAFSSMIGSVLSLFPGFCHRKNPTNNSKDVEDQKPATQATSEASTIETVNIIHNGKGSEISNHVDTASEDNVSDLAVFSANKNMHHDICDLGLFPTENIFPNHKHNEMLSHYNHIFTSCFKDIFQSVATSLCHLNALSIALSELQGAPLRPANYLETKEANAGKTLNWSTLKQHLTSNYLEIPYDTHAINAYDILKQSNDESTEAYLHRAQDILEYIHHTNDMSSISAIGTNHAKIVTGLKDGRLCNKLAESKAKKWINMLQVLQDVADMTVNFERSHGYSLATFEVNQASSYNNCPSGNAYRSTKPPAKEMQQPLFKTDKIK